MDINADIKGLASRIQKAVATHPIPEVFHEISRELKEIFRADRLCLVLIREDKLSAIDYFVYTTHGNSFLPVGSVFSLEGSITGEILKTRNPVIVKDTTEGRYLTDSLLLKEDIRSRLGLPLFYGGEVIGALCMGSRMVGNFSEEHVAVWMKISPFISVVAENARLIQRLKDSSEELTKEINERKRMEEELKALNESLEQRVARRTAELAESEEKFRKISASAQDAIIMLDNEERVSYWNEAAEKMFNCSKEEAIGENLHKLIIPDRFRERHLKGFKIFQNTGHGPIIGKTIEVMALRKGGTEFPIELSLSGVQIKGKWNAIGIVRDITERKGAEEVLRRTVEERNDSIKEMKHLMDFSTLMREETRKDELIEHMAQVLKNTFAPDILAVLMLDKEKNVLDVALRDPPIPVDELLRAETILDPSLCRVMRTGHEHIVRDINRDPSCSCLLYKIEKGGYVCFPIIAGGATAGVVLMIKKEEDHWGSEERLGLVSTYVGMAAAALHRVQLMDITRRAAVTDSLTGVYNRRFFDEMLEKQMALARRHNEPLGLLIADLDHFKDFNDTCGHLAGDHLLQQVARILKNSIRSSDVLTRYGGEEFAIIMPTTDITGALDKAEKIRQGVESTNFDDVVPGQSFKMTISIGTASFPMHGTEYDTLVGAADKALYKAKRGGRNRVEKP
jgi:diguanylate cyclase (GGDEF)-like protein/PAS domain S-box-containing protein